jgi:hypothetical protein
VEPSGRSFRRLFATGGNGSRFISRFLRLTVCDRLPPVVGLALLAGLIASQRPEPAASDWTLVECVLRDLE